MDKAALGLVWASSFVILEAARTVFYGGVFQNHDFLLIDAAVFGFSSFGKLS